MSQNTTDETVYVVPNGSGETPVVHTDPDCPALKGKRDPTPKPQSAFPGRRVCARCRGDVENTTATNPGRWREGNERDRAVLEALRESDTPLSRRDLEFDAHLSRGQVRTALENLRECGLVKTNVDDDDARRPVYQTTDRARLNPLQTVALLGVIATVLMGLLAIGVILG